MVAEDNREHQPDRWDELCETVAKARAGDASALPRLRELLDEYPNLVRHYGDLARQAEGAWVALATGSNLYLRETVARAAEARRAELTRPGAQPVEKLLVERVVACFLQLNYFSATEANSLLAGDTCRQLRYHAKRVEQAQRMYLAALGALVTFQKLTPHPGACVAVLAPAAVEDTQALHGAAPGATLAAAAVPLREAEAVEANAEELELVRVRVGG
jgi:hypothetical protein